MGKEVHKFNGMSYSIVEGNPKSSDRNAKKHKKKTEKVLLKRTVKTDEDQEVNGGTPIEDNHKSKDGTEETAHAKRKKLLLKEATTIEEEHKVDIVSRPEKRRSKDEREERQKNKRRGLLNDSNKADEEQKGDGESIAEEVNPKSSYEITDNKIDKMENGESNRSREEQNVNPEGPPGEEKQEQKKKNLESRKNKKKQQLLEEAAKADQRGICYLSRIPPHMDPIKLRQILSQYGEIQRIYLAPEDPTNRVSQKRENRKRDGGFQEQGFSEGWVEFTKKSVAKRVANMLNGEQIGGRKRSPFYYDLWNINYLSKFKWDDLTAEIAYKNAIREQKLALEISAAKRERDFYLSKVDQSRALNSIKERIKKKQKVQQESQTHSELPDSQQVTKVIRQFPQKQPVADKAADTKPRLSKDILAGVFGGC